MLLRKFAELSFRHRAAAPFKDVANGQIEEDDTLVADLTIMEPIHRAVLRLETFSVRGGVRWGGGGN